MRATFDVHPTVVPEAHLTTVACGKRRALSGKKRRPWDDMGSVPVCAGCEIGDAHRAGREVDGIEYREVG